MRSPSCCRAAFCYAQRSGEEGQLKAVTIDCAAGWLSDTPIIRRSRDRTSRWINFVYARAKKHVLLTANNGRFVFVSFLLSFFLAEDSLGRTENFYVTRVFRRRRRVVDNTQRRVAPLYLNAPLSFSRGVAYSIGMWCNLIASASYPSRRITIRGTVRHQFLSTCHLTNACDSVHKHVIYSDFDVKVDTFTL